MRDAVGEELGRRLSEPWRWRPALAAAIALHVGLAALVALAPSRHRRALQLPSVQVRMVAPAPAAARPAAAAGAPRAAAPAPAPARRQAPKPPSPTVEKPPRRSATRGARTAPPPTAAPAPAVEQRAGETRPDAAQAGIGSGAAADGLRSPGGGIGLAAGNGGSEEAFPFSYYLARFVSSVEANWFRPPAPAGTRCRVRCRIDRSGRLLEAGLEEPSGIAAFDRAALRAIYASTPFPPLPQGFGGSTLTVHLDFGPG